MLKHRSLPSICKAICHLCKEPLLPRRDLWNHAAAIHDLHSGHWRPAGGLPRPEQTGDPLPPLPISILGMGSLWASPAQNGPPKICCRCSQPPFWAWEASGPLTPRTEVRSNGSGSPEVHSGWGGLRASHTQNRGWERQQWISGDPFWVGDASSWPPTPRMEIGSSGSGSPEVCSGREKALSIR